MKPCVVGSDWGFNRTLTHLHAGVCGVICTGGLGSSEGPKAYKNLCGNLLKYSKLYKGKFPRQKLQPQNSESETLDRSCKGWIGPDTIFWGGGVKKFQVFSEVLWCLTSGFRSQDLRGQYAQRVQSTYIVQSMVSVVVISLMVWVSIPHMGT